MIDLNTKQTNNVLKKVKNVWIRFKKIKQIKKKYKIDCSISFLTGPNLLNVLTKNKDKTIISIRNNLKKKNFSKIVEWINKFTCKKADHIITVSKQMEQDLIKEYSILKNKITTIYNVCDIKEIEEKKQEEIEKKDIFGSGPVIITLGRLIHQKAHWHLIRSFSKVVEKFPKAKLIILGRGELETYLSMLIKQLGLEKNVIILEFQKNPYPYLDHSDIFILPSLFEGMSNAILDAIACELPIIVSDCKYGNKEIVCEDWEKIKKIEVVQEEEYGILIPTCDGKHYTAKEELTKEEKEMAKAMLSLLEHPEKYQKYKEASKKRKNDFGIENYVKEWINKIEE